MPPVWFLKKATANNRPPITWAYHLSALGRWVRAERKPSANESVMKKPSLSLADQGELIRLRKENEQLRMEREILKKAAVFFAKEAE
jgi:transposase